MTVLLPALLLAAVGVAMVYAATYNKAGMPILHLKQIVWLSLALVSMLFFASLNYQVLIDRYAFPAYWALVVLLAFLLAAGQEIAGSRRWLSLGPFGIQPSEFAKIATVLVLAKFLAFRHDRTHDWSTFWGVLALAGLPMLLILREPDLGTALVFIPSCWPAVCARRAGLPPAGTVGAGLLASPWSGCCSRSTSGAGCWCS